LVNGEQVDLATPRATNYIGGGLVLSGVQRTTEGTTVSRVIAFSDIAERVTLARNPNGEIVEDPTLPLPGDWL
jgi:hypothetical protein